jgi:hypothetical protein
MKMTAIRPPLDPIDDPGHQLRRLRSHARSHAKGTETGRPSADRAQRHGHSGSGNHALKLALDLPADLPVMIGIDP